MTCHGEGTMAKAKHMSILCACKYKISISRNTHHVNIFPNLQIYTYKISISTNTRRVNAARIRRYTDFVSMSKIFVRGG